MTELNLAYGFEDNMYGSYKEEKAPEKKRKPQVEYEPPVQQAPPPPTVIKEPFQNPQQYSQVEKTNNYSYSFWDRMVIKRPEVVKLGLFSLVILLAIALEKVFSHYINKYLADNIFTYYQELLIRFAYPISIFLVLWIIKSM